MSNLLLNKGLSEKFQTNDKPLESRGYLWRSIAVNLTAIISAVCLSYFFYCFASREKIILLNIVPELWLLLTVLSVFFIASLFQLILVKDIAWRTAIQVFQVICLGSFLYNESVNWLAVEIVATILIIFGSWRARSELNNGISIHFFNVSDIYFKKLILAIALLATIFYYPHWDKNPIFISQSMFDKLMSWSLEGVKNFYPDLDININSTFDSVIASLATFQINRNSEAANLTPSQKEELIIKTSQVMGDQFRNQLAEVDPKPDDSLNIILYRYLGQTMKNIENKFSDRFYIFWIVSVLLILFGLGRVYSFVVSVVAFALFQVLLAVRFLNFYSTSATKEIIDF